MTPVAAARSMEAAAKAALPTGAKIAFPNSAFTPPTTGAWYKLDILWGSSVIVTKDMQNETVGVLQLAVFTQKDRGDGALATLAEVARAAFNRELVATDISFAAASGPVMLTEDSWRQAVVSIPFRLRETVT